MTGREKKLFKRIIISAVLFFIALPLHYRESVYKALNLEFLNNSVLKLVELVVFIVIYLLIGYEIIFKAIRNISKGQVFDENFLMTVASIGAFILGEFAEGVAVILFYQVGELFQSTAVSESRRSISALMDIRPDYANILKNGEIIKVNPEEVKIDDSIIIKSGERIPLDGVIIYGDSVIDTSALTGESMPRDVAVGDNILSGCINKTGNLTVRVTKEFGESTASKILELVENATDKKSKSENFITRFARYYTPLVIAAAVLLAILPPLLFSQPFAIWIERALTFLVISCPCALVISVPLSFFGGIGGASRAGVLIKGSNYLEQLSKAEIVAFDKTGTLTKGNFEVSEIFAQGISKQELLELAAYAESYSSHPIAVSIRNAYNKQIDVGRIGRVEEIAGKGIVATVDEKTIIIGNAKLMNLHSIRFKETNENGTAVYVAIFNKLAGYIVISDELKEDAESAIRELKALGIKKTVMLTGDAEAVGKDVAIKLGIDSAYTQLLPSDKVNVLEGLLLEKSKNGRLCFVGDGINDAPALAISDIGIAMGGLGSDAAIEAADVVIMTDQPSKIPKAIEISKKTMKIVRQNIVFALAVKGLVLALGALGVVNMWAAVFADVGVSILAILNAMRAGKAKYKTI